MSKIQKLNCIYTHLGLPTTIDDSLSYYEVLCKLQDKINEVIENDTSLENELNNFKQYVEQEIARINNEISEIPEETKTIIQEEFESGKYDSLIKEVSGYYFMSVKNPPYGLTPAKGDGITNDYSSISAIISYAKSNIPGGKVVVYFPSGHYIISDTIDVPNNVVLAGFDPITTKIEYLRSSGREMFILNENSGIKNITIEKSTSIAGVACIRIKNAGIKIDNVNIWYADVPIASDSIILESFTGSIINVKLLNTNGAINIDMPSEYIKCSVAVINKNNYNGKVAIFNCNNSEIKLFISVDPEVAEGIVELIGNNNSVKAFFANTTQSTTHNKISVSGIGNYIDEEYETYKKISSKNFTLNTTSTSLNSEVYSLDCSTAYIRPDNLRIGSEKVYVSDTPKASDQYFNYYQIIDNANHIQKVAIINKTLPDNLMSQGDITALIESKIPEASGWVYDSSKVETSTTNNVKINSPEDISIHSGDLISLSSSDNLQLAFSRLSLDTLIRPLNDYFDFIPFTDGNGNNHNLAVIKSMPDIGEVTNYNTQFNKLPITDGTNIYNVAILKTPFSPFWCNFTDYYRGDSTIVESLLSFFSYIENNSIPVGIIQIPSTIQNISGLSESGLSNVRLIGRGEINLKSTDNIYGAQFLECNNVVFENFTFNLTSSKNNPYPLRITGNNVTFENCKFNGGYISLGEQLVTFNNCSFNTENETCTISTFGDVCFNNCNISSTTFLLNSSSLAKANITNCYISCIKLAPDNNSATKYITKSTIITTQTMKSTGFVIDSSDITVTFNGFSGKITNSFIKPLEGQSCLSGIVSGTIIGNEINNLSSLTIRTLSCIFTNNLIEASEFNNITITDSLVNNNVIITE